MFELLPDLLKVNKPHWLIISVAPEQEIPVIRGGVPVFIDGNIGGHYNWQGVCESNGGNFDQGEGNVIEIDITPQTVMQVIAKPPGSNDYMHIIIANGATDDCDIDSNNKRQDIHSSPTGPGRPAKPHISSSWGTLNKELVAKSRNIKD